MELRPINLCAYVGKSAAKASARETPREHLSEMGGLYEGGTGPARYDMGR